PQDLYQTFCNVYAYYKQASHCNPTPNRQRLFRNNRTNRTNNSNSILSFPSFLQHNVEVHKNAIGQRDAIKKIEVANKKISEYERMYQISTDRSFKKTLNSNILKEKSLINEQEVHLKKLKHYAEAQARLEAKKTRLLQEEGPCHSRASAACHHHHPAKVALASVA
ncbi:17350_t:CDS:2, partial [Dentiscutata erythropus]